MKTLLTVKQKKQVRITSLNGGQGFQKRLRVMGIREGQLIKVVSKQPFRGPLTLEINGCQITIGRGMANRIVVEDL